MIATTLDARTRLESYLGTPRVCPLFVLGDALEVLREFPSDMFDCCMTSPPYWGKREYVNRGIGLERDHKDFIRNLSAVCLEIKRVLKPTCLPEPDAVIVCRSKPPPDDRPLMTGDRRQS